MMKLLTGVLFLSFCMMSCAQQKKSVDPGESSGIAFPGAEGFGKYTTGGRGGRTFIVSNLEDKGPGSFREAAEANEKRIIVFAVSGTIRLQSRISIRGNVTIAGQTAPGDGICIADQPVVLGGNNIIVRYLRFRMGDRMQNKGKVDGSGSDDAFGGIGKKNIILDHCSMSWSTDEVCTIYNGDSTTLQWNIIAEPLNYSYHFETGDKDFENHGYGGIWGGKHMSAHHNLFAHCMSRNPRFAGIRSTGEELVDYRNNVLYNWGHNNIYGGEGGNYNLVNNFFKYGPSTARNVRYRIVNPSKTETIGFGKYHVEGNFVSGSDEVTNENRIGVHMGNGGTDADKTVALQEKPFAYAVISPQSAKEAYEAVLMSAGASFRRDTLDQRIINDVKNGTGRIIDVQGGFPHGTAFEITLHAWPVLKSVSPPADTDRDGMPDDWERKKGLDPTSADGHLHTMDKHYTNIEIYINSILE